MNAAFDYSGDGTAKKVVPQQSVLVGSRAVKEDGTVVNMADLLFDISEKLDPKEAQVFVVRLDGNEDGPATAKLEGQTFIAGDIGNTFTLSGQYISYDAQWLGNTEQDAELDWNGLTYTAGTGTGTAGYNHSDLPTLTEASTLEFHTSPIALTAQPGAVVEFRYKVLT